MKNATFWIYILVIYRPRKRALNDDKSKEYERISQELIQLGMNNVLVKHASKVVYSRKARQNMHLSLPHVKNLHLVS
jgi:hypothetical protein